MRSSGAGKGGNGGGAQCLVHDYVDAGGLAGGIKTINEVAAAIPGRGTARLQAHGSDVQAADPKYNDVYRVLELRRNAPAPDAAAAAAAAAAGGGQVLLRQVVAEGGSGRGGKTLGYTNRDTDPALDE